MPSGAMPDEAERHPVSVVIPTSDAERSLPRLLASLSAPGPRARDVIVVDARSGDDTCDVVERFRAAAPARVAVRLLASPVRNVAAQRNQGAAVARHDTIVFLDADVVIEPPGRLDALIRRFHGGRLAAASCRFRPVERDLRAEVSCTLLYAFQRLVERWRPHAWGACIITSRDVFRFSGGFDPRLRAGEGANFCRKAGCLGRVRILPVPIRVPASRLRWHGRPIQGP